MTVKFDYIDSDLKLIAFSNEIASAEWLAVDTEFMRERTYYAQLALIQIASEHGNALIDVPALDSLEPLVDIFTRDDCLKIMHSASQDMEVLSQTLGVTPTPLFDTQIAASFLGETDQIAYGAIVKQRLGIDLSKDQTRTNWLIRPLSAAQRAYAEADVLYLYEIYEQLHDELIKCGRLLWVEDESQALAPKMRLASDPELSWQRLRGLSRLNPSQQKIACEIARWREQRAQQRDLPREWILNKQALMDIARLQPETVQQLSEVEGLSHKVIQRIGSQLIKLIEQADSLKFELATRPGLSSEQRAYVKKLMLRLRNIGTANNIAPSLIANRSTIENLVQGDRDLEILKGWRAQLAGEELLVLLDNF